MALNALPAGFLAKISRAKEHLVALNASFKTFSTDGDAYSIVKEVNREAGEYIFRIRIKAPPPLVEWSLVIGDCLHNTRSALDHLFWALVSTKNPTGLKENVSAINFPVLRESATFNGRKKKLETWVGKPASTLLEKLQPYNAPGGWNKSSLMFLHDFDIADKHKLLLPAVHVMDKGELKTQTVDNRTVVFDGHAVLMQFEDNAIIAAFKFRTPQDVVDADYLTSLDVIFEGQPGPSRVISTLEHLIEVVEGVGNDFRHLL